jgi:hypothetical protein
MIHRRRLYQSIALAWILQSNALAHNLDVSTSEFTVDGNTVHAHIEVAAWQLVSDAGAPEALRALVMGHTDVTLGAKPCVMTIEKLSMVDRDGAALDAKLACPEEASDLHVRLDWLRSMPSGHRHVAHLISGKTALTALLTAEHDSAAVTATAPTPPPPPSPSPLWVWAIGLVIAALVIVAAIRIKR